MFFLSAIVSFTIPDSPHKHLQQEQYYGASQPPHLQPLRPRYPPRLRPGCSTVRAKLHPRTTTARNDKTVTVAVTVKNTAKTPLENYFVAVAFLPRDLDMHKARLAGGVALKERKASCPAIGNGVAVWSLPSIPAKKTVRVLLKFDTPVSNCISANATAPTNLTFVMCDRSHQWTAVWSFTMLAGRGTVEGTRRTSVISCARRCGSWSSFFQPCNLC